LVRNRRDQARAALTGPGLHGLPVQREPLEEGHKAHGHAAQQVWQLPFTCSHALQGWLAVQGVAEPHAPQSLGRNHLLHARCLPASRALRTVANFALLGVVGMASLLTYAMVVSGVRIPIIGEIPRGFRTFAAARVGGMAGVNAMVIASDAHAWGRGRQRMLTYAPAGRLRVTHAPRD
jgi:hypothetical protein